MAEVDVIMPVYRGGRYLASTLESLRAQTFTDWQLIVVDDACPDHTGDLAVGLQPDLTLVRLEGNGGPAAARSRGVGVSDAPFLALLDQDDLWHPAKLEKQVAALRSRPTAGGVHTDAMLIDDAGAEMGEADTNQRRRLDWDNENLVEVLRAQFAANRVLMSSAVVRREAWLDLGGQSDPYGGEDWGFWVRLLGHGWSVAHIAEPLLYWRRHDENTSLDPRRHEGLDRTRRRLAIRYAHRIGPRMAVRCIRPR